MIISLADEIVKCAKEISDSLSVENSAESLLIKYDYINKGDKIDKNMNLISKSEKIYKSRRNRESIFNNNEIFSEPAWDILLDLFSSHLRGKNVSVTSACMAANVPASTALRWMNVLEEAGLVERVNDPSDGRRTFVQVTPNAIAKLTKVLAESP